jgi:serine/threonine-protein kinase
VSEPERLDSGELEQLAESFEPTKILDQENKRIGRYELVWELGTGGMAAVFLARARGPAGFHKWFAIKRIHPHLAKDKRFVDMFLDEARIAAAIHHPNVAQVFDLGAGDEHYIAMEYLHGEHLGVLAVRAVRQWGRIPYEIAARIVGAAADGLHHAHEARGPGGETLGLVHRDVSPQNVFVTYEGTVKLTDFGIAKAENRITHTQTGAMKGKCAYMAPEQALGQTVDRRTDVFALGIVLWEITTGRRLFKAETDAQTLMRITSGKVRRPSELESSYPPELERIVMRALATRPENRYPTAAAMARDLDRYIASTGKPAGRAEVRALMTELFSDRIHAKEDLLRSEPGTVPDFTLSAPAGGGSDSLPAERSESEVVFKKRPRAEAEPRTSRRPLLVGGIALLAGLSIAGAAFLATRDATAVVRIDTTPSGANVVLDGVVVDGTTPLLLEEIPEGRHGLRIELAGFSPMETTFDAEDGRMELDYRLQTDEEEPDEPASLGTETVGDDTVAARPEDHEPPPSALETPEGRDVDDGDEASEGVRAVGEGTASTRTTARRGSGRSGRRDSPAQPSEPAYLNIITRPWASVTVNGQAAGQTPLMRYSVEPGGIVVRLRAEGDGPAKTIRLRARPGETVSRSIDLR